MKAVGRIILAILALPVVAALLLLITIRFGGLPLGLVEQPLRLAVQQAIGGGQVTTQGLRLVWNPKTGFVELVAREIALDENSGAGLRAGNVNLLFSDRAFWQKGELALAAATVETLILKPDNRRNLPASTNLILPNLDGGGDVSLLTYLSEVAIRDIRVGDYEAAQPNGSHFLVLREGNRISATADLAYEIGGFESTISLLADVKSDGSGHADIELNRLDPRDIGRFSSLFSPLRGVQLPVTALIGVDFVAGGQPSQGTIELYIEPGSIGLAKSSLDVREMIVSANADFANKNIAIDDLRFNISGVAGRMSGRVAYSLSDRGQLKELETALSGEGILVDLPKLFAQKLTVPRAEISAFYDLSRDRIEIERLDVTHNFGMAQTAGMITVNNRNPVFDFTTRFGKMSRQGVEGLWPLPIAPRTRDWVAKNITGGSLIDGSISLNASLEDILDRQPGEPMRDDAMLLDLDFENLDLRYLPFLPPLVGTDIRLFLRGKSFEARAKGGSILLPSKDLETDFSTVAVASASFETPHYRDRMQAADIRFSGTGVVRDVVRAVNRPPLKLVENIDFDFDRLRGEAFVETHLNLAVFAPVEARRPIYKISARTDALELDKKLGPFALGKGRGFVDIDNDGLRAMGRAEVDGHDTGFQWHQPFGADAAKNSKLAVHGLFSPQAIADFDQAWAGIRLKGAPHVNLLINGPPEKPDNFRLYADLQNAELSTLPLAYVKPQGESAHVKAVIENNAAGEVAEISGTLSVAGETATEIDMSLDGDLLTGFEMTPISLGRDKNLLAKFEIIDGTRIVEMTADVFDASRLFDAGNRDVKYQAEPFEILPFLGKEAVITTQMRRVVGEHNVEMDNARMRIIRKQGLHEELDFQGVFADGADMVMSIERDNDVRRRFLIQTERAGNVFRMFDWASEMYGGNLVMTGTMYDEDFVTRDGQKDIEGRMTMTAFRVRNVPVLASILTLASLTGIADTLSGDGIKFQKAQGDFSLKDGRLTIDSGRMHGAAVGLTMQGDYDIGQGDVDIGGTLVPAYTLNSFLGNIPLVGPVLTGRRGEGIIGIGYRVAGEGGKANALVNPLSILTPGVFRRIFELGIGLGDKGDTVNPDLDEPDLIE